MRRIGKQIYSLITILTLILFLSGCNSKDNNAELEKKVGSEIIYLDNQIVKIANKVNNIDDTKYILEAQEDSGKSQNDENSSNSKNSQGKSGEQEISEGQEKGGGEEQSKEQEKSGGQEENKQEKSDKTGDESKEDEKNFSMEPVSIFSNNQDIQWQELENTLDNLFFSWQTIQTDLKQIGINEQEVQSFSNNMDILALSIKSQDKDAVIDNSIKLYNSLPIFLNYSGNQNKIVLLKSKYNLLICYKYINAEDWKNLATAVSDLKMNYSNILNKKSDYKGKEHNIDISMNLINEISNSINAKDKNILFTKYRSLMQNLNMLLD